MSSRRGNVHGSLRRGVADVEVVNEGWITAERARDAYGVVIDSPSGIDRSQRPSDAAGADWLPRGCSAVSCSRAMHPVLC